MTICRARDRLIGDNLKWRNKVNALPPGHATAGYYAEWHAKSRDSYLRRLKGVNTFILKLAMLAPPSTVAPRSYNLQKEMASFDTEFLPPIAAVTSAPPHSTETSLRSIARERYQSSRDRESNDK